MGITWYIVRIPKKVLKSPRKGLNQQGLMIVHAYIFVFKYIMGLLIFIIFMFSCFFDLPLTRPYLSRFQQDLACWNAIEALYPVWCPFWPIYRPIMVKWLKLNHWWKLKFNYANNISKRPTLLTICRIVIMLADSEISGVRRRSWRHRSLLKPYMLLVGKCL